MTSFAKQVAEWAAETKARADSVLRKSVEEVVEQMQRPVESGGNMPTDTGFLRSSLQVSGNLVPTFKPNPQSGTHSYQGVSLALAGLSLGKTVYATYTADYASQVNYGTSTTQGRQFVGLAAQRWVGIVTSVCAKLRSAP